MAIFDEAVLITAKSLGPNSLEIVPLSLAIPQVTVMHLFEEIVKTGAIFVPLRPKMAENSQNGLIKLQFFRSKFPGHWSPILGK